MPTIYLLIIKELADRFNLASGEFNPLSNPYPIVAKLIQRSTSVNARKAWLVTGVIVCLAALAYFKYFAFLLTNLLALWRWLAPSAPIPISSRLLPLGISFFVFHAISLLADCYRGKISEPVQLGDAPLYVAFFPQLIAGPILRASCFLPQLAVRRNPAAIRVNRAFLLIVSGLFKKVVTRSRRCSTSCG